MVRFLQEEIGIKNFLKYTLEGKRMRKVQIKKKLYMQISTMILCIVVLTTLYSVNTFAKSEKNEVVGKVYEFDKNDDYDISEKNGVPAYEVTSGNLDLYYTYSDVLIDKGTDAGGAIEVYENVEDAEKRRDYLATYDGTIYANGTHTVIGTVLVRTSNKLMATQQKELEQKVIDALTRLE